MHYNNIVNVAAEGVTPIQFLHAELKWIIMLIFSILFLRRSRLTELSVSELISSPVWSRSDVAVTALHSRQSLPDWIIIMTNVFTF